MVRRASAARNAVARSIAQRNRGAAAPDAPSSVFFASPGAAYQSVTASRPLENRFNDVGDAHGDATDEAAAAAPPALEGAVVMDVERRGDEEAPPRDPVELS